jgi:serine/threonine protein kinase
MPGLGTGTLPAHYMLQVRYIILNKLGQGGMGAVYKVADQHVGNKLLAIKEMSDAALTDPYERQQAALAFQQEAQMLAHLDHPNIPKVSDFFTENQKHYIAMEFVPGETLEDRLAGQGAPCGEQEVRAWVAQLCDVLSYLHSQTPPIIFRDLKPANIMITPQGQLKLIDFGIARFFQHGKGQDTQVIGTPGFAPPEQYGRGQTDARSDVYSLGVTLHHLLTLHDPASTPFKLPPARQLKRDVSPELEKVVLKATQPEVADRYQSVGEMARALSGAGSRVRGSLAVLPTSAAVILFAACIVLALGAGLALAINAIQPEAAETAITDVSPASALDAQPPTLPLGEPAGGTPTHTPVGPASGEVEAAVMPTFTPAEPPTPTDTPTREPTPTPIPASPTPDWAAYEAAVTEAVRRYSDIKVDATTYLNASRLDEVLIDPVLERQKRSVCWLRNEALRYEYSDRDFGIEDITFEDERHALLLARVVENRVLYRQNGSVYKDYGRENYRAVYELVRTSEADWYISCFQSLEEGGPVQCQVELSEPNPCNE